MYVNTFIIYVFKYIYKETHQVGGGTHGGELGASFFHKVILEAHITHVSIQIEPQILLIRIRLERSTFFYKFIEVIGVLGDDRVQDRFEDLPCFVLPCGVSPGVVAWCVVKCSEERPDITSSKV